MVYFFLYTFVRGSYITIKMNMKKKSLLIVLISLVGVCVMAQERYVIRGNVCNEDGQPMVGANIYIWYY